MPRRRRDAKWCVLDTEVQPPQLLCTRCDNTLVLPLPMRIEAAVAYLKAFTLQHQHCPPKENTQ